MDSARFKALLPALPSIAVHGTSPCARGIAAKLAAAGYPVNDREKPTYDVVVEALETDPLHARVEMDTAPDTPLEQACLRAIGERLGGVYVQVKGTCQLPHGVVLRIPNVEHLWEPVELALLEAFDRVSQRGQARARVIHRRDVWRLTLILVGAFLMMLLFMAGSSWAQGSSTIQVRDATTGAVVPNVGDDATDSVRTYISNVGHFICDSGCGSPPATADKTAFTFGTTNVTPIAYVVDDVATNTVSENTYGIARMTTNREALAYISNIPHFICDSGCGSAAAALMADATANPTIPQTAAFGMAYNGATWDRMRGSIASGLLVNVSNASLAVTGTFWQATQPVSGTFWATTAGAPSSTRLSDGAAFYDARSIRALTFAGDKVDATGSTVTVTDGAGALNVIVDSGAVTVSNSFLLDATYTGRTPAGTSPADAESNTNTALSRVGTYLFGYNGTTWDRLRATTANGLAVDVTRVTGSVTVTDGSGALNVIVDSGSLTANAGTNLNTSALNLETTQTTVAASLNVLDDWDETDRAKVNPIVGQAGVQGASGTVTALTQRMVLATDVALPAGTNALGVVSTKTALTFNAPTAATVGVGSAQALASNASRKSAVFVNTSNNTISCAVGATAVLNSGITLWPGGTWAMNEYSFGTGAVNCIASAASSNLAIQELQ